MTSIEIPTQPPAPAVNPFAERLWARLPQAYRDFDALDGYPLRLYIDAVTQLPGALHTVIERIAGERAAGPARPEPWSLSPEALEQWRATRVNRSSALGDPFQADDVWLDWLGQIVGTSLHFVSDEVSRRNAVRYAVAGWRAGTRPSIEYAARPTLTGSQYARCVPHMRGDATPPTVWDVAIITRASETPDSGATVDAIARAGVKPAGVVLHHRPYAVSWDVLAAKRPIWNLWTEDAQGVVTWNRLAETGLSYADVPGNLLANSSFEDDLTGWTERGANTTATHAAGGLDGFGHASLTAIAAGQVSHGHDAAIAVNDLTDYRVSASVNPVASRTARIHVEFDTGSPVDGTDEVLDADTWGNRMVAIITTPVGATEITDVSIQVDGLALGEAVGVDAWDLREHSG